MTDPLTEYRAASERREDAMYVPALEFLNTQPGTVAWLHHNNGIWLPSKQTFVRKKGHEDGVPDILGVKLVPWNALGIRPKASDAPGIGLSFAFEFKRPGKLRNVSEDQQAWLERFARVCGGVAYVVDSVQDVMEAWAEI